MTGVAPTAPVTRWLTRLAGRGSGLVMPRP